MGQSGSQGSTRVNQEPEIESEGTMWTRAIIVVFKRRMNKAGKAG